MQKPLVIFNIILPLTSTTVNRLINIGFTRVLKIRHDETNILTFVRNFYLLRIDTLIDKAIILHRFA